MAWSFCYHCRLAAAATFGPSISSRLNSKLDWQQTAITPNRRLMAATALERSASSARILPRCPGLAQPPSHCCLPWQPPRGQSPPTSPKMAAPNPAHCVHCKLPSLHSAHLSLLDTLASYPYGLESKDTLKCYSFYFPAMLKYMYFSTTYCSQKPGR